MRRSPRRRGRLGLVVLLLGLAIWFVRSRRAAANVRVQPWPGVQPVPALVPPAPAQPLLSPSRASATIAPSPVVVVSETTTDAPSTPPAEAVPVEPEAPAPVAAAAEPVEPAETVPAAPEASDPVASAAPVEPEPGAASAAQAAEAVPVPDEPAAPSSAVGETQATPGSPETPPASETAASMFEPAASAAPPAPAAPAAPPAPAAPAAPPAPAAPAAPPAPSAPPAPAADVTTGSTTSPDDAETELLPVQPAVSWARPVEPEPHSLFTPAPPRRATPRSDRPSPRRRKPSPSPQTSTLPPGAVAAGPDGSAPDPEYTIKASTGSLLFHSPASPYFRRTKAEIWFRSAADAQAAGFTEWAPKKRTES
ncbi:hypothetical protein [Pseudonocardia alaniniphila]|uniref:sunset domain-containing protein n=1 Tax=Pseudonocardia alaniniphila TaxID=75291 RepID=UPI001F132435|nr:hypothetical protein [Pseudonocardia alaniniphila]